MTYTLPFKPRDKVLEAGGGDRPLFRPNMDARKLPTVDIVCDLNERWPIEAEAYDGFFSMFLIEHLSWRKVRNFIGQIHSVLKPGGIAVLVTANLSEQAKKLVETPEWNDDLISMLYGDQNYEGGDWIFNAHHCGFSPQYAVKLFREAEFHSVTIYEWPPSKEIWGRATDMVIEARKSGARVTRSL